MTKSTPDWASFLLNVARQEPDIQQILQDFLDVFDAIERLKSLAEPTATQATGWDGHLTALHGHMLNVFTDAGVAFFDSVGQCFDPKHHHAVKVVAVDKEMDGIVVEELAKGCFWQGKILRVSQVVVGRYEGDV